MYQHMQTNQAQPDESGRKPGNPEKPTTTGDQSEQMPQGRTEQSSPDDDTDFEALAQSEIGGELYDYGDGGGPDASSSGLRSRSDDEDAEERTGAGSSDADTGAGVGSDG